MRRHSMKTAASTHKLVSADSALSEFRNLKEKLTIPAVYRSILNVDFSTLKSLDFFNKI